MSVRNYSSNGRNNRKKPKYAGRNVPHKQNSDRRLVVIAVVALVLVVTLLGIAYLINSSNARVVKGVSVEGMDASGMTMEQMVSELRPAVDARIAALTFKFTYEDNTWSASAQELGIQDNLQQVAEQALGIARTPDGNLVRDEAARIKGEGKALDVSLSFDENKLRTLLEKIAKEMTGAAVDAQVTFNPDGDNEEEMFQFTPEEKGVALDLDATVAAFAQAFGEGNDVSIAVSAKFGDPQYTEAFLRDCTHPLVYDKNDDGKYVPTAFRTQVGGTKERKNNVKLAISKFNGLVVWPGQEVSFNEVTGERNAENGYLEAKGIAGDQSYELTFGGGVCQASTTLYNALLMADANIIERNRHSIPSGYVKKGFDAMVNWPGSDMKFSNRSDGPLFIKTWYKNDYAYVQIYGLELPDDEIIIRESDIYETVPAPEDEIRVDEDGEYSEFVTYSNEQYVYREKSDGIRVHAILVYINKKTGEEVSRETLNTDYYKPIGAIIYVGKIPAGTSSGSSKGTSSPPPTIGEED